MGFLTGFFYSIFVNPVLQYSVLIFSLPWLLFWIFGVVPDWKGWRRPVLVSLIGIVMFVTLITQRQYYDLFYRSRFKEFVLETDKTLKEYGHDNCLVIMDSHEKISDHYYAELDLRFDHINYDDLDDNKAFIEVLKGSGKEILSIACDSESDLTLPNIIRDYFPRMLKKIDYYGGNYYVFSKDTAAEDEYYFRFRNSFNGEARFWSEGVYSNYTDTTGFEDKNDLNIISDQERQTLSRGIKDFKRIRKKVGNF